MRFSMHGSKASTAFTYAFTINYILGAGILSIPAATAAGGIVLSVIFMLVASLLAAITAMWQVESSGRASELTRALPLEKHAHHQDLPPYPEVECHSAPPPVNDDATEDTTATTTKPDASVHSDAGSDEGHPAHTTEADTDTETETEQPLPELTRDNLSAEHGFISAPISRTHSEAMLLSTMSSPVTLSPATSDIEMAETAPPFHHIPFTIDACYEGNQLVKIFFGPVGERVYEVCLYLYLLSALWTYAGIFAASGSLAIPIPWVTVVGECDMYATDLPLKCTASYWLFLALFALVVVPMSCTEMKEQVVVQVALTLFRFFAIAVMLVTMGVAILRKPYDPAISRADFPYTVVHPPLFNWAGIGQVFSTTLFAQLFHHSTTPLMAMLHDKRDSKKVFFGAIGTTCVLYVLIGVVATLYFGDEVKGIVSLQWMDYTAERSSRVWYAVIISYLVILFPPIDLLSAFPLNGVTLGNNIAEAIPLKWRMPDKFLGKHHKVVRIACRLVAVVPPLIGAVFVRKATVVVQFGGLAAFLIMFFAPALVQLKSWWQVKKLLAREPHLAGEGSSEEVQRSLMTPYGSWYSFPPFPVIVIVVGSACFVFSCFLVIQETFFA
ncbi:Amino acid transporter transmembrane [Carpediemonas membranifera]|uniref:Amino acid transporter transmembrane n=1 Tax=Carpediemonas membranifera TaxID=201153 RepID=A0A8J6B510_9EUKA|nr:Amino acid transporter transmembrane [Carpediemonas membranifera]|eukprot:KAG9393149.1 Amino acid transporter transmembrane [Carpediemonas membranifera]